MVECECYVPVLFSRKDSVLIDTWWNVNENALKIESGKVTVLIDTWWNVNV